MSSTKAKKSTESYWSRSAQPLYCLAFVAPLLLLYELGMVLLGPAAMRNGADVWLREFLESLGVGEYFFLPLATCGALLCYHHLLRERWSIRSEFLSGMVLESFALGVGIILFAQLFVTGITELPAKDDIEVSMQLGESIERAPQMLSYLGAGIYEELLFRMLLLTAALKTCQRLGVDRISSVVLGVASTSILFAAAHYRLFFAVGVEFTWYSFWFRVAAGAIFGLLYLRRGFGIVVGTHAVYDILVATVCD